MNPISFYSKKAIRSAFKYKGFDIVKIEPESEPEPPPEPPPDPLLEKRESQYRNAWEIIDRHDTQTLEDVQELREKYARPVFGRIKTWDLILMQSQCVDPTDLGLCNASQLTHVLQIIDAMQAEGNLNEDLLLAALIHDLGKLLLLTDEDPANVVCMNGFITEQGPMGLDQHVSRWNHDEFVYMKLKDYLPDHLSWLIRYHSTRAEDLAGFMDSKDTDYFNRYHVPFYHYDQGFKNPEIIPASRISDYRPFVESKLPEYLEF